MEILINSIESSIKNKNWTASILNALILPDIAGKISYPNKCSSQRYEKWFEKYVEDKYTVTNKWFGTRVFFSGKDCYALRCALLHEGSTDISSHKGTKSLDEFHFYVPDPNIKYHNNIVNKQLHIQIDIFVNDIIEGVKNWLRDIASDDEKNTKLESLIKLYQFT